MSGRLEKNRDILRVLLKSTPRIRRAIIGAADRELLNCLCECAVNILHGTVDLTPEQRAKLRRYRRGLRLLANRKAPVNSKREILQTGGFLGVLLAPLATSVLMPIVSGLLK